MSEWIRFMADKYEEGLWFFGANIFAHKHGIGCENAKILRHVIFQLNLGWWYVEMEVGYEPQD